MDSPPEAGSPLAAVGDLRGSLLQPAEGSCHLAVVHRLQQNVAGSPLLVADTLRAPAVLAAQAARSFVRLVLGSLLEVAGILPAADIPVEVANSRLDAVVDTLVVAGNPLPLVVGAARAGRVVDNLGDDQVVDSQVDIQAARHSPTQARAARGLHNRMVALLQALPGSPDCAPRSPTHASHTPGLCVGRSAPCCDHDSGHGADSATGGLGLLGSHFHHDCPEHCRFVPSHPGQMCHDCPAAGHLGGAPCRSS